jgi:hypothetical protein
MSDYPRGFWNGFFRRCWLAVSDSLAITPALPVASLFSYRRRSVALLRLPARPSPRRTPAFVTAIALSRPLRTKTTLASLQQTAPRPRAPAWRLAGFPIFGRECVESWSGPTGVWLPEAHALEGTSLLSGAQQIRFSADSRVYRRARGRRPVLPVFSRLASAVGWFFGLGIPSLVGNRLRLNG